MSETIRHIHGKHADLTAKIDCPLCGARVRANAVTCPRCKSRLDAEPPEDAPLSNAFTEEGALRRDAVRVLAPGNPDTTEPLPVLSLSPQAPKEIDTLSNDALLPTIDEEALCERPFEPKRRTRTIAAGIAAGIATLAFLAGGVFMASQANALNQITDDVVEADVRADSSFSTGSAANDFVAEQSYSIDAVLVDQKEVLEDGVEVRVTVRMSNSFFEESRKVALMYQKNEDGWTHTTTTASHTVHPIRGIAYDDEYGIVDAEPVLDGSTACQVGVSVEGQPAGSWFARTWGTRVVSYAFDGHAWSRTNVDDSQLSLSYQELVGTYAASHTTAAGHLASFVITSVDDATGTFEGQYAWRTAEGFFSRSETISGSFTGSITETGDLVSQSDGHVGSVDFTAMASGDQTLQLELTLYSQPRMLSFHNTPSRATYSVALEKQSSNVETRPEEEPDAYAENSDWNEDEASNTNDIWEELFGF